MESALIPQLRVAVASLTLLVMTVVIAAIATMAEPAATATLVRPGADVAGRSTGAPPTLDSAFARTTMHSATITASGPAQLVGHFGLPDHPDTISAVDSTPYRPNAETGGASFIVDRSVSENLVRAHVRHVGVGQRIVVTATAPGDDVQLTIYEHDGRLLSLSRSSQATTWDGALTTAQDYTFEAQTVAGSATSLTLLVEVVDDRVSIAAQ